MLVVIKLQEYAHKKLSVTKFEKNGGIRNLLFAVKSNHNCVQLLVDISTQFHYYIITICYYNSLDN